MLALILNHLAVALAAMILGGFGRRIAGGLWGDLLGRRSPGGDGPIRLAFGLLIAASALLAGAPLGWSVLLAALTFAGSTTGNFDGLTMGRVAWLSYEPAPAADLIATTHCSGYYAGIDPRKRRRAALGLTVHGLLSAASPALLVAGLEFHRWQHASAAIALKISGMEFHWGSAVTAAAHQGGGIGIAWIPVLLSGLLIAPCYEAGYRLASYQGPLLGWERLGWPCWLRGATQFAEFGWGACLGLGTVLGVWLALVGW